jgi:hypothetical protein
MTLTDATNQQHCAANWYKYASATVFESKCAQQIAGAISAVLRAHVWLHVNACPCVVACEWREHSRRHEELQDLLHHLYRQVASNTNIYIL